MLNLPNASPEFRRHLDLVSSTSDFTRSWSSLGAQGQVLYGGLLQSMDRRRRELGPGLAHEYGLADSRLARKASEFPDWDFQIAPDPAKWAEWASDVNAVTACYAAAWERLQNLALSRGVHYVTRWNSMKRHRSVVEKIEQWSRGEQLDLWDVVRFRFVLRNLEDTILFADALLADFGCDTVRVRNYYRRTRLAYGDKYRALHLELALPHVAEFAFFEVQLLTTPRDAVGLIDHAVVHKSALDYRDSEHRDWLEQLRMAAGILDAGLLPKT